MSEELLELKKKHRELDTQVKKLGKQPTTCSLRLQKMKRQKFQLKEQIAALEKQKADDEVPPTSVPAAPPTVLSTNLEAPPLGVAA